MRLSNVNTGDLAGFEDELICRFILAADMVGGGIREFVNDTLVSLPVQLKAPNTSTFIVICVLQRCLQCYLIMRTNDRNKTIDEITCPG